MKHCPISFVASVECEQRIALYTSEFIYFYICLVTLRLPCFEAWCGIRWIMNCFLFSHLPSLWYKFMKVLSLHRIRFQNMGGLFFPLPNLNLIFLFLNIPNPLFLQPRRHLLVIDFDNSTFPRVFLTSFHAVKGYFSWRMASAVWMSCVLGVQLNRGE